MNNLNLSVKAVGGLTATSVLLFAAGYSLGLEIKFVVMALLSPALVYLSSITFNKGLIDNLISLVDLGNKEGGYDTIITETLKDLLFMSGFVLIGLLGVSSIAFATIVPSLTMGTMAIDVGTAGKVIAVVVTMLSIYFSAAIAKKATEEAPLILRKCS